MSDYNLSGLHPREFEHLIQALAKKVIAPGVRIYGDGPDGGREATYDGPMGYPSAAAPWSGYLVIQAKFLQRPFRQDDEAAWALGQLKGELDDYCNPASARRKPEYYILATNAVLTPVGGTGSIDRVDELLETYADRIGLKGHAVWHHDEICRFLDGQEEIRRRYFAFLAAGDVLAQVVASLATVRPDFGAVMANFLQKQLLADRYVKLGQAGESSDGKTPLAQVFVDLAMTEQWQAEPPSEGIGPGGRLPGGFVAVVLEEAGQLLDPRTLWGREEERRSASPEPEADEARAVPARRPDPGRYVLVGGPGQGKSTLGQYLCQLHRAAILDSRPAETLTRDAHEAIQGIRSQCERDGLELPGVRRYPVRIVLTQLAAELASGAVRSVLDYLAAAIRRVTTRDLAADDMRAWLASYPWILVLDGLDEVPASSNRAELLRAVEEFWTDVAECNADVIVVATTRPQGYEREFAPDTYRHVYLAPLSAPRAMHYAGKLVEARYHEDVDGRRRVLGGLEVACGVVSTSKLMRTPLQVTIMALLIDRYGEPPGQRWPLFQKYFDVIYDRELAKGGPTASILRDHPKDVAAIHHRVGLRLQLDGERAGTTEALLGRAEFEALVRGRLAEVGRDGRHLDALAGQIVEAAMRRLVFLVEPIDQRVGFEVRSLQEFMAAGALTDGDDARIRNRLVAIAPVAYWRNVLLFAAGHWVARGEHAFDSLITTCDALNEDGGFGAIVLEGSRLALDLLEDGLASEYPKHQRTLARKVLRLLRHPPEGWVDRLACLMTSETEDVYFEEIADRLDQSDVFAQLGAWDLLHRLVLAGSERARDLFEVRWPSEAPSALEVLRAIRRRHPQQEPIERAVAIFPGVTFHQLREAEVLRPLGISERAKLPGWFVAVSTLLERSRRTDDWLIKVPLRLSRGVTYTMGIVPIGPGPHRPLAALADMPVGHPAWAPIVAAARFIASPSPGSLGEALRAVAAQWDQQSYVVTIPTGYFPWPLAECIASGVEKDDFLRLAEKAEAGEMGDVADWEEAEQRWGREGIDRDAIVALTDEHWPFDRWSLRLGLPFRDDRVTVSFDKVEPFDPEDLIRIHDDLPASRIRSEIAALIVGSLGGHPFGGPVPPLPPVRRLIDLVRNAGARAFDARIFARLQPQDAGTGEWVELFDLLGSTCRLGRIHYSDSKLPEILAALHTLHPDRPGLVNILGKLVVLGYSIPPLSPPHLPREPSDSTYAISSLLVRLARPIDGEMEAERLAEAALALVGRDPYVINRICEVVIQRHKGFPAASQFLAKLLPYWPPARWLSRSRALSFIEGDLQARTSPLNDPRHWRALGLPDLPWR